MKKKMKPAAPRRRNVSAIRVDELAAIIGHAVQNAMRPDNPAGVAVEQYVSEKTACTALSPRTSPITKAIDALAGLHNLEARVHTLMASVVGMPPNGSGEATANAPSPCGVFNVLDLAADDAFSRTERIHQMLATIERALP